jgi:hypothetical protein
MDAPSNLGMPKPPLDFDLMAVGDAGFAAGNKPLPRSPIWTIGRWGGWWDSNPRHPEPQSGATTD